MENTKKDTITLRDYFAMKAMPQVMLSFRGHRGFDFEDNAGDAENIAINSYIMADAMLKQREKALNTKVNEPDSICCECDRKATHTCNAPDSDSLYCDIHAFELNTRYKSHPAYRGHFCKPITKISAP